ncbi:MAG: NAD-binding protein [Bifidobacteriaceae bacterium]|jgi:trk system potassium uptake protein TrkA|nr:NAD-binding protein [Bifidobacteriaceae bacterium]
MRVLIIGLGSVGESIAHDIDSKKHDVIAIEKQIDNFKDSFLPESKKVLGDGSLISVLEKVDAAKCDIAIIVSGSDDTNLVASIACKLVFGISNVYTRVNDTKNEWLFDESWGVDHAISIPTVITKTIDDDILSNI